MFVWAPMVHYTRAFCIARALVLLTGLKVNDCLRAESAVFLRYCDVTANLTGTLKMDIEIDKAHSNGVRY
jgi:hypothetical protein